MGWIKRNLFFVVGGVVSLALLGGAGFYIYSEWARNAAANDKLTEIYSSLASVAQQQPGPGLNNTNTQIAKEQDADLRAWINSSATYFQPIASIPSGSNISSEAYAAALSRTVDQMQHAAESAGIALPPKYGFSFEAQRSLVKFAPGSLDLLAQQLGEVKAITDVLFPTRINALDSIQRVRVSDDDTLGSAADYLDDHPVTNELATITPYVVTFRCFTPELARVLSGIAKGSNTFIIKTINVLPSGAAGTLPTDMAGMGAEGGMPPGRMPLMRMPGENYGGYAPQPAAPQPLVGRGGFQTLLKEQLLRVVVEVRLVKLLPKS